MFKEIDTGATMKHLNVGDMANLPLPVPAASRTTRHRAALSDVDALIGALDKLIAKKRDLKQAAMQQLLTGKKRLPGFAGEWEKVTLECVCVPGGLVRGPFGGALKRRYSSRTERRFMNKETRFTEMPLSVLTSSMTQSSKNLSDLLCMPETS